MLGSILGGAMLAWAAGSASSAEFTLDRTSVPGRTFVILQGQIIKGDLIGLQEVLAKLGRKDGARPALVLTSPGGSYFEGLALALEVKRRGLPTLVLPGTMCASACSLVFFGGSDPGSGRPDRTVYGDARIGVHHTRASLGDKADGDATKRMTDGATWFYDTVHISPEIRRHADETPPDELYVLRPQDLTASAITVRSAADAPAIRLPDRVTPTKTEGPTRAPASGFVVGPAFLKAWRTLVGQRVRVEGCTLLAPQGPTRPCAVFRSGVRIGVIAIDDATLGSAAREWSRQTCSTPTPMPACLVALTGLVEESGEGPLLKEVAVQPIAH